MKKLSFLVAFLFFSFLSTNSFSQTKEDQAIEVEEVVLVCCCVCFRPLTGIILTLSDLEVCDEKIWGYVSAPLRGLSSL